jgi:hypothetical protein
MARAVSEVYCYRKISANVRYVDLMEVGVLGEGLSRILQVTEPLKAGMEEALMIAKNAADVMSNHADDEHVSAMLKLVLGEGDQYRSSFDVYKSQYYRPFVL